jgi:hypothetical protein
VDCAWLYCLSLAHAAQYVRAVHVSNMDTALQQYLFGGQVALQEKRALAAALARLAPKGAAPGGSDGVLPEWFPQLRELLVRHLRRPTVINDELRYAEWAVEAQLAKERATAAEAFGALFSPVAAKLLSDVCGFLVTVASLNPDFRAFARTVFAQPDLPAASAGSAQGEKPALELPISTEGDGRHHNTEHATTDGFVTDVQPGQGALGSRNHHALGSESRSR